VIPLAFIVAALSADADASRLAVIHPAADFTLTTQDGDSLKLSELRGKVVLVSFVFTKCNGSCPATTSRISRTAEALKEKGLLDGDAVRLISVTLDPHRDTPEALKRYMRLHDVDAAHWSFLTGPPEQVGKVLKEWDMWTKPMDNGQIDHPSRVFLLDKRGRVREVYNLEFFKPAWVVEDVRLLLDEGAAAAKEGK
jgi:protein SCO1/2